MPKDLLYRLEGETLEQCLWRLGSLKKVWKR